MQRYIYESEASLCGAPAVAPMGINLVGPVICEFGSPWQKEFYLPRIRSGEDYWCQGFSEPGAGSDLSSLKTKAVRDGDHYIVTGEKIWTTHAHFARSEEHTSELQSLMRISYAVFCLKKKKNKIHNNT